MKTLFILALSLIIGSAVPAQTGTVTINVKGNRVKQIAVDNQYYEVNNSSSTGQKTVTLSSVGTGQHSLEIVRRTNSYNATTNSTTTNFTLRSGYDLTIDIASNGSVTQSEKRTAGNSSGAGVSTYVYNRIYTQAKNKTSSSARASYLQNEFNNTNRMFTSQQVSNLIKLVNSENLRFELAKQSYTKVVDKQNFNLVSSLLNSTSNRNDLNTYIAGLPVGGDDDNTEENATTPMSSKRFQVIYNEVLSESGNTNKNYYLSNFFSKDNNFYTSSQARQLIQLVTTEAERFYLAKVAYRGVTDRANYGEVSQLLSSSTNRSQLAAYINTYNSNTGNAGSTGVAMSSTDFSKLYQSAYYQNSSTAKFSYINSAFNTAGYYFTAAQEKQLIQVVTDEYSRLQLAKTGYAVMVDKANYMQLYDLLNSTASRSEYTTYVNTYGYNNNNNGTGYGTVMSDASFNTIYNNVNSSWSASTKANIEADAFASSSNYFSTYQVSRLLQLITSESDRLTLAKASYDNVVDKTSFTQIYDLFNNTVYRNDLARFVTGGGGIGVIRAPMTDADFSRIQRDVQYTFGLGAKMSELTKIFNNETYYFTAQQAKQLIELVSLESNRLDLAKAAYNNLTDPTNYAVIKDLFSSQSSKDQLDAYVSSNPYLNN